MSAPMHLPSLSSARYSGNRKRCSGKCKALLPATEEFFASHPRTPDGFQPACRDCNARSTREYRARVRQGQKVNTRIPHVTLHGVEHKSCAGCGSLKPADAEHFYRNAQSWDGLTGKCKDCTGKDRSRK